VRTRTVGRWRVYLVGEPTDLTGFRRELSTGPVTVAEDDVGTYLQAEDFEGCADADAVQAAVAPLLVLLNGMASLSFSGHRRVGFSGTIARDEVRHIYLGDSVRLSDDLNVVRVAADLSADGVVTGVDGIVRTSPGLSSMQRRLASIATHPELAAVYHLLGLKEPSWGDLYKALELLGKAVGGEQRLTKRTGVARERIKVLKGNSNDPELTGDDARHAVPMKESRVNKQITLAEGLAILDELIQGYVRLAGFGDEEPDNKAEGY
jgi:hypothetical protein